MAKKTNSKRKPRSAATPRARTPAASNGANGASNGEARTASQKSSERMSMIASLASAFRNAAQFPIDTAPLFTTLASLSQAQARLVYGKVTDGRGALAADHVISTGISEVLASLPVSTRGVGAIKARVNKKSGDTRYFAWVDVTPCVTTGEWAVGDRLVFDDKGELSVVDGAAA